jgi:hypothetical protein
MRTLVLTILCLSFVACASREPSDLARVECGPENAAKDGYTLDATFGAELDGDARAIAALDGLWRRLDGQRFCAVAVHQESLPTLAETHEASGAIAIAPEGSAAQTIGFVAHGPSADALYTLQATWRHLDGDRLDGLGCEVDIAALSP